MVKTRNPLSLLLFFRRNAFKLLPFILIILSSVFSIIASYSVFNSLIATTNFYSNLYKKCAIIIYRSNGPDPIPIMGQGNAISKVYDIEIYGDSIEVLFGEAIYPIIGVKKEDANDIMRYFNVKLKSGRMFIENEKALLISEQVVKNKRYKIGEQFNKPRLKGYKLVGILGGETAMGLYLYKPKKLEGNSWATQLITFKNPSEYRKNAKLILKNATKYTNKYNTFLTADVWDEDESVGKMTKKIEREIGFVSNISIWVSMIIFSLISISLNIVYSHQRLGEYGLYLSFGLSKFQIIKKSFLENFSLISISWIFGIMISRIFLEIMKQAVFTPRGWRLNVFPLEILPYTLIIPISIFVCGFFVFVYRVNKLDAVEIIERKW